MRSQLISIAAGVVAASLGTFTHADDANPLNLRTYTEDFTVTYANAADAASAKLTPEPVLGGKTYAFSARWDDNNPQHLKMHELMQKHGLLGTFYLNQSTDVRRRKDFGGKYLNSLVDGGFSIGGHTQTHPFLVALNPNTVFYEILANRIDRETGTDQPINSFAFPFGRFQLQAEPAIETIISRAFVRSGYFNTPYADFAEHNPNFQKNEVSTSHQVTPGDHQIDGPKFDIQMEHVIKMGEKGREETPLISLGVHVNHQPKDWDDLEAVFTKYAGNPDWWYCTMTQFAAYDRQRHNTELTLVSTDGATQHWKITRPIPDELENDVPLTLSSTSAIASAAAGDTPLKPSTVNGKSVFDLPHAADQKLPTKIDASNNLDNSPAAPADLKLEKLPGITAWLSCDPSTQKLSLQLHNSSEAALSHLKLTLRLPPEFTDGLRRIDLKDLQPGEQRVESYPLGEMSSESLYQGGRPYYVAELNFDHGSDAGRIFATTLLPLPPQAGAPVALRDATHMLGPLDPSFDPDTVKAASVVGAPYTNIGDTPTHSWYTAAPADGERYGNDEAMVWLADKKWVDAARPFDYKPQTFVVAIDFKAENAGPTTLLCEDRPTAMYLNGEKLGDARQPFDVKAGDNRLVLVVPVKDGRTTFMASPLLTRLTPASGKIEYIPAFPNK